MPVTVTFIADPSPRAIAARLRGLKREFRSWRPAWRAAAPLLARGLAQNLAQQGAPIGASWPPLKPETVARKARLGRGRTALVGTGEHLAAPLGRGGSVSMTATRLRVGVPRTVVANVHAAGSPSKHIPKRAVLEFSPPMEAAVLAAMNAWARELLSRAEVDIAKLRRSRS